MIEEGMEEVVQEFLVESAENLDQLDVDLVALEHDPSSRELLAGIFRSVHTIKGTTGFLGFGRLEKVAHVAESLLSKLRDGLLELDPERATALLDVVDAMRGLLALIEETGSDEDDRDLNELVERLTRLQDPNAVVPQVQIAPSQTEAVIEPAEPEVVTEPEAVTEPEPEPAEPEPAEPEAVIEPAATASSTESAATPDHVEVAEEAMPSVAEVPRSAENLPDPPAVLEQPASVASKSATPQSATADASGNPEPKKLAADRSVRVDIDLLDALMRQVGELVLARNQVLSLVGGSQDITLTRTVQRFGLIVSELQRDVMKTRMQPVEQLWAKLPRVVRDLATQFRKQIDLRLEGGDTELDRSILEAVKDPLTHLVRNAVDHGIESPEARLKSGKPATGTLLLRAFHESGQVVLEMTDDGAGIDPAKIGAKAVERGVLSVDELKKMSDREVSELIFRPGFSTAAAVTNVSGRGVGMDVVRTNIEKIGGSVDLSSVPGSSSTFRIRIPLTLAIIPALLVGCRGSRYAIPQIALQELVRLDPEATNHVEQVSQTMVYRLRGRLLPLVRLDESFNLVPAEIEPDKSIDIAVVQTDDQVFGIVVDKVYETQEIVVKPLGRHIKHLQVFAGSTILGDGAVSLILDVAGLADVARIREVKSASAHAMENTSTGTGAETTSILVARVGSNRRVAIPLTHISRLEEISSEKIERAGNRSVIQYRGELMPLVSTSEIIGEPLSRANPTGNLHVVVCTDGTHSVGIVVDAIVDVSEEVISIDSVGSRPGIVGTIVVQNLTADLLDMPTAFRYGGVEFNPNRLMQMPVKEVIGSAA